MKSKFLAILIIINVLSTMSVFSKYLKGHEFFVLLCTIICVVTTLINAICIVKMNNDKIYDEMESDKEKVKLKTANNMFCVVANTIFTISIALLPCFTNLVALFNQLFF